jgi:hypothetical protein
MSRRPNSSIHRFVDSPIRRCTDSSIHRVGSSAQPPPPLSGQPMELSAQTAPPHHAGKPQMSPVKAGVSSRRSPRQSRRVPAEVEEVVITGVAQASCRCEHRLQAGTAR